MMFMEFTTTVTELDDDALQLVAELDARKASASLMLFVENTGDVAFQSAKVEYGPTPEGPFFEHPAQSDYTALKTLASATSGVMVPLYKGLCYKLSIQGGTPGEAETNGCKVWMIATGY